LYKGKRVINEGTNLSQAQMKCEILENFVGTK